MIRSKRSFELWISKKSENKSKVNELVLSDIQIPKWRPPIVNAINDVINAIENKSKTLCTGEDGKAALEIALAFHESQLNNNSIVKLPLKNKTLRVIPRETSFTRNGLLE
jgi:hypothetical protein